MNILLLVSFVIYFCILAFIGALFYKKTKTATGYILGDRSVNYYVTAIATQASDMGSWFFLGFPAAVYLRGLPEIWTAIGLASCMFLTWQFIAKRLRDATEHYNSTTLTNYLSHRFNDKKQIINSISSIVSLYFFTYYIAAGLVGLGILFESAFDISYFAGLCISLTAALAYTLAGGFLAVAWTDFFQGLFLIVAIIVVPLVALFTIGLEPILTAAQQNNIPLSLFSADQSVMSSILLALGWGLGYFGQPHILTNFMGIDDPEKIKYAKYIGMSWLIIGLIASASVGLIGIGFVPYHAAQGDQLFITMALSLFPALLAGFALCGIIAATLSTMDSHILLAGSTIGNYAEKNWSGWSSHKHIVGISRIVSIIVALAGLIIAYGHHSATAVYNLTNYAWSGLGSTFGPVVLCSLYIPWTTQSGALVGMLTGALVSGLWSYFDTTLFPLVPGFFGSLGIIILVSLLSKKSKIVP